MGGDFSLFTSMRYDPKLEKLKQEGSSGEGWNFDNKSPFYMLDFHRDRLLRAATHWNWQHAIDQLSGPNGLQYLAQLVSEAVGPSQTTPLRMRIIVSRDGDIKVEKFNAPEVPLNNLLPSRLPAPSSTSSEKDPRKTPNFTLLVDQASTSRSEYTHFKTTKRAMYDAARQRACIAPTDPKEVLIVNQDDGFIMEGTITTPYFWRNDRWVTPPIAAEFSWDEGSGGQDGTSRRWALETGLATEQAVNAASLVNGEECWISNGVRGFISATISLQEGA
ncbi:aminodeoxychorismate lyase [Fusarium albosuccineum]|uniref:Aminodeoxychorismate lyase n=1 Tax=Fusarium albosuccineum TaxID=1237068 RepID=A0A8H4LM47_9HYPO|nr:aminodeoxychorismate lyase [Fusarium albosuccineum]